MTLYVIFPIHVNFSITSRCVLKATVHRKKTVNCFMLLEKDYVFSKECFYSIVHPCCIWLIFPFYHDLSIFFMFLSLWFINYFCHIMFYKCDSFSKFIMGFPFQQFSFNKLNIWKNCYCYLNEKMVSF